jgi:hypothetical protein
MNILIRQLYALLIAGAVVAFVGFGVNSLYQPPKYPDFPNYSYSGYDDTAYRQQQSAYNNSVDQYKAKEKNYQRKATHIALSAAVVFLLLGLFIYKSSDVIGEGLGLGGAGTSIYAVVTASLADNRGLRFLAVTILLISILVIAHRRFYIKPPKKA